MLETTRVDPAGRPRVVLVCSECDGSDMAWRLEHEPGPEEAA